MPAPPVVKTMSTDYGCCRRGVNEYVCACFAAASTAEEDAATIFHDPMPEESRLGQEIVPVARISTFSSNDEEVKRANSDFLRDVV